MHATSENPHANAHNERASDDARPEHGCTLKEYSEAKKLSEDFLRGLVLRDVTYLEKPAVRIPYPDEEGKEVVRWNATRHGIRSPAPVVPGVEKKEDWEEHRDGVLESLQPEGHLEFVLAERVALLSWRLHRVTRFETESIALYQERIEEDLAGERRFGSHVLGAEHPEEVRWKLKDAQRTHRTLKHLPGLPADKHLSGGDAAGVLWGISAYIEDEDLEKVQPPSEVPDWAGVEGDTAEWDGWTVGMVMEYMDSMASAAGESPEELLEAATEKARLEVISAKRALERVEQDLARMSRERLLPRVETLEKVARYEGHLSRGLFKALHELEALQIRRSGGAAPLARLDVDVLAGS